MRKLVFSIFGLALLLAAATAFAQDKVYALSYFSNAHTTGAPDAVLRLVNDGKVSDSSPAGDLCASIYVFDSTEELEECCSCRITPNGILSLSLNRSLTNNTATGRTLSRGVVVVVSSSLVAGQCDAAASAPHIGIRAWLTHIQQWSPGSTTTTYAITEEELAAASFGSAAKADLAEDCGFLAMIDWSPLCSCSDTGQ